jgi:hypothetical protein
MKLFGLLGDKLKQKQAKNRADSKKFINAKTGPVTGNEAYSQMTPENVIEGAKDWQENNKKAAANVINAKVEPVKEQEKHKIQNNLDTQKKNADSNDIFQIGDKAPTEIAKATTEPESTETVKAAEEIAEQSEDKESKNKYKKASRSIWDAYLNGDFGDPDSKDAKDTRNYFILDAISSYMKNTGKDIRNIGAIYGGGTMDNSPNETSKWEQEQANAFANEGQADVESEIGTPAWRAAHSEELNLAVKEIDAKYSEEQKQIQLERMANDAGLSSIELENASTRQHFGKDLLKKADKEEGLEKYWYLYWGDKLLDTGLSKATDQAAGAATNLVKGAL